MRIFEVGYLVIRLDPNRSHSLQLKEAELPIGRSQAELGSWDWGKYNPRLVALLPKLCFRDDRERETLLVSSLDSRWLSGLFAGCSDKTSRGLTKPASHGKSGIKQHVMAPMKRFGKKWEIPHYFCPSLV